MGTKCICHFNLEQMVKYPNRVTEKKKQLPDRSILCIPQRAKMVQNVHVPHIRLGDNFRGYFSLGHKAKQVKKIMHTSMTYIVQ